METEKYYLRDIESGCPYEVTKREYEQYLSLWERFMPKFESSKGTIMIFGTGGDMEGGEDFKNSFYGKE